METNNNENATEFSINIPGNNPILFYIAHVCHFVAFSFPNKTQISSLMTRIILCVGQLSLVVWALLAICSTDMAVWNIIFLIVNASYVLYLGMKMIPSSIPDYLGEVYLKLFKPLKISKQLFKRLIKESDVIWLEKGEVYAAEDITSSDMRLSLLLSGRMKVSCDGAYLHYIFPNQFIDSPEWLAAESDSCCKHFQVTITAEERTQCIIWPKEKLHYTLLNIPVLKATMDCLIGKDVTKKLYSLSDCQAKLFCPVPVGRGQETPLQRCHSVDTVHIGNSGLLRSDVWLSSHATDSNLSEN